MERFSRFLVKHNKALLICFAILVIVSFLVLPMVKTNYDLTKYLPDGMVSKNGIVELQANFGGDNGLSGSASVMLYDVTLQEAKAMKAKIAAVNGVGSVLWLDDSADLLQPEAFIDPDIMDMYYRDGYALMDITFVEGDSSMLTDSALSELYDMLGGKASFTGQAVNSKTVRDTTQSQISSITFMAVPMVMLILLLVTSSWLEPVIFLLVIGVSVLLNMASNILLPDISYLTQSMSGVLQLAVSMDYSIFLLHSFSVRRKEGLGVTDAMREAVNDSFSTILASSMTTMAGFLAICLMRFKIGQDMGLVFAKGIFFSLMCVILLLPSVTILCAKLVDKAHHRTFLPSFGGMGKALVKFPYITVIIIAIVIVPAYMAQSSNTFVYGDSAIVGVATEDAPAVSVEDVFGLSNPVIILFPKGETGREIKMAREISQIPFVSRVQGLSTLAPEGVAKSFLPAALIDAFESGEKARMVVNIATHHESAEAFAALDAIKDVCDKYYPDVYAMTGSTVVASDIKDVVSVDYNLVNLLSILAVGVIILLNFRSALLPVILVASIETAVCINMAVPYFRGYSTPFIGYLIVSAIQLGATIDYAILLTSNYVKCRAVMPGKKAAAEAISQSAVSVLTSAGIMAIAGFSINFMSSVSTVAEIGLLIGRGALLSGLMVFTLLPQLLVIFDRAIEKTMLKSNFFSERKS